MELFVGIDEIPALETLINSCWVIAFEDRLVDFIEEFLNFLDLVQTAKDSLRIEVRVDFFCRLFYQVVLFPSELGENPEDSLREFFFCGIQIPASVFADDVRHLQGHTQILDLYHRLNYKKM